jgi:2-polyprenyl-6-methoxyphenol hydroxylase-like FAD-dependent oxidoreductase
MPAGGCGEIPSVLTDSQVLIAGAGPTGLVLALWLNRLGVRVRLIDKAAEPGTTSRALVVHARTLEFYRCLGMADEVVRDGTALKIANLWAHGRRAGRIGFGEMGLGLSPFPYLIIYPQDVHERMLIERLAAAGVTVERPTELIDFRDDGRGITARLRHEGGAEETCRADFLAGCDGARSNVRETLGVGFTGSTYAHLFYVADVEASGPVMNRELNLALDESEFLAVFPLLRPGNARLIGTARTNGAGLQENMTWDDVGHDMLARFNITVERVNWFSTYRVHHRVAGQFRKGRAFLLGDAAHIHSPVGGQGMNTGIGDAVNLSWKLAAAVRTTDAEKAQKLLDTYEPERIAFARRLVATTDRAFTFITRTGRIARFVRVNVVPRLLPRIFAIPSVRRAMFRAISQIAVKYPESWLSEGVAGAVHGGDRLPWVPIGDGDDDNFRPLAELQWQVHVYGEADSDVVELCRARGVPLHVFDWSRNAARARLRRGSVYLIRPDGYVGLAQERPDARQLEAYLNTHAA